MKNKLMLHIALSLLLSGFIGVHAKTETPTESAPKTTEKPQETHKKGVSSAIEASHPNSEKAPTIKNETSQTTPTPPTPKSLPFAGISSLRGMHEIKAEALVADIKQLPSDRAPIVRNYFQQPPLIPHRIREYRITTNNNKCLSCHSWKNYKKMRATKISQTHFTDRDGNAQSTVAARRYFCTQCHVPQVDAKPLVENLFKPVNALK